MKVIVDRFEAEYAVVELENKKMISMPKELIPKDSKEATVITTSIDLAATKKRNKLLKSWLIICGLKQIMISY